MSDYPDSGDEHQPRTLATLAATSSYEHSAARLAKLEFKVRQLQQDADSMSGKIVALTARIAELERKIEALEAKTLDQGERGADGL